MTEAVRRAHKMPCDAAPKAGGVRFRLHAPGHGRASLKIAGWAEPLNEGWHEHSTAEAEPGARYHFAVEDGTRVREPASRRKPEDVHGPSEVVDPLAYAWNDAAWLGRPWEEAVIYEVHVGDFTPEGTFRAAIERLGQLAELGVTAVQLMPIAAFSGARGWGHDGVLLYAPEAIYGQPDDLKALVDAAHERGPMVFLEVVHNHFEPDGNDIGASAPDFFLSRHRTPWGDAIPCDGERSRPVRDFMIHSALYWQEEFHLDGLRLDAVHAIVDDSPTHLLDERVRETPGRERSVHLIVEDEANEARRLERDADGHPRTSTARWSDDIHHVLYVAAMGEDAGHYGDYQGDTEKLGRALAEGFAFRGARIAYSNEPRDEPSGGLPPTAFISFIQDHDQIENRAFGDRLTAAAPAEAVRALAAVYLLAPQIPMIIMGEEWAAMEPIPFFCDFHDELGKAVREGRRGEFAAFSELQDEAPHARIPDSIMDATFRTAKLDCAARSREPRAERLDLYQRLLETRRREIIPRLGKTLRHCGEWERIGEAAVAVDRPLEHGATGAAA